jgi:hypothetical protein
MTTPLRTDAVRHDLVRSATRPATSARATA